MYRFHLAPADNKTFFADTALFNKLLQADFTYCR